MGRRRFYYCQSSIESRGACKRQCSHCKEYYKPLEVRLREDGRVPRKLKKKRKKAGGVGIKYRVISIVKSTGGSHTITIKNE